MDENFLKTFRRWCKDEDKMSGKSINKFLGGIQFGSEWLKRGQYIPSAYPPLHLRVDALKNETERFPPLTHEEKQAAYSYFRDKDPGFHLFMFIQYYTCIRGAEMYHIQRKDIDFKRRTIYMAHYNTKNGNSNYVQILQLLYDRLIELHID